MPIIVKVSICAIIALQAVMLYQHNVIGLAMPGAVFIAALIQTIAK